MKGNCFFIWRVKNPWVNPSLGGTLRNHLKEWLRNKKQPNHFFSSFKFFFHNNSNFFFHVYPLHILINGLNFIWE